MFAVVVLSAVLILAVIAVVYAYRESRLTGDLEDERYAVVQRRIQALNDAVSKFRGDTRKAFVSTGGGIGAAAKKTMGVLDSAIRLESLKLQASNGRSRRAIAVMQALLDANDKALRELLVKLDVEDKETLDRFMREMESRHVEVVSYLSGGGLDRVATALESSDIGTADGFSQNDIRTTLTGMGITITDADLTALDAGVRDDIGKGLSKRESLYIRLAAIAPVVNRARELKLQDSQLKADRKTEESRLQFQSMVEAEAVHRDAMMGAMGTRVMDIDTNVQGQTEKMRLTREQNDAIRKMISTGLDTAAAARTALSNVVAASKV
jgi:hypothetical protein